MQHNSTYICNNQCDCLNYTFACVYVYVFFSQGATIQCEFHQKIKDNQQFERTKRKNKSWNKSENVEHEIPQFNFYLSLVLFQSSLIVWKSLVSWQVSHNGFRFNMCNCYPSKQERVSIQIHHPNISSPKNKINTQNICCILELFFPIWFTGFIKKCSLQCIAKYSYDSICQHIATSLSCHCLVISHIITENKKAYRESCILLQSTLSFELQKLKKKYIHALNNTTSSIYTHIIWFYWFKNPLSFYMV